jgi:hypothetical protein
MRKSLKAGDLRAYAGRPWELVGREKLEFLARRYRTGGPVAALAAAQRLVRRFTELHPEGICPIRREDDLAAHVSLKRQFEQARNGFRGR